MNAFRALKTQFQLLINFQDYFDYFDYGPMIRKYFLAYTRTEVRQFRDTLIQHMEFVKKSIDERTQLKRDYDRRVNKRLMQTQESKVDSSKALDASLVVTSCSGTKSDKHNTSSSSGTYITHAVDADIRPVNDQVPFAEVQLTTQHNVLANEPIYDTYLLEKVDSNTTPDSTNICHRGGEIDQDAEQYQVKSPLLNAELFKTKEMIEKETYNELSHRFLLLEKHCISLELEIQQKDVSFQSHKPGKNHDAPEFREFFKINDLKAQLQAKTTLICNLKNQIKSVKEESNEAKVKNNIDVIETINIKLEHRVAKLLAANEQLHKENEHLKQTYKELYDSIKKTRVQNKDNTLKNELRKLKGNSVDTKFAKPSILEKPVLQPPRNQSVVRQPNAFKFERPNFSKPQFASHVDVKNNLPKPVTLHYLPKVRESVFVKPHHVIASGSSRNSSKESYRSNDMAYKNYLESRNNIKPAKRIPNVNKLERWISKGYRVSLNKSFAVHEKPNSLRSCLRWKPTGRIFKNAGLRWIPIGKMFTDSTTKVDSEPPNGSNDDITIPYECDQTLNVSACTLNLSACISFNPLKKRLRVWLPKRLISHKPGVQGILIRCTYTMASADNTSDPAPQQKHYTFCRSA
ncbi:hypothetical protein Tco_0275939 [Tanacetum coccineum]